MLIPILGNKSTVFSSPIFYVMKPRPLHNVSMVFKVNSNMSFDPNPEIGLKDVYNFNMFRNNGEN